MTSSLSLRLLVADIIRRHPKWMGLLAAVALAPMWWWGLTEMPGRVFAMSMGIAFLIGPQTTLQFLPRAIWYLPVRRRDAWRANWLVATLGATLFTTTRDARPLAASFPVYRNC